MGEFSLQLWEVAARWGYSEVINCPAASSYGNVDGISDIKLKRDANILFEGLTCKEKNDLAQCML